MASYLSRSLKFEAPPTSKYDEQLLVNAIENFDEGVKLVNTSKTRLDHENVQLIHAHQETNSL